MARILLDNDWTEWGEDDVIDLLSLYGEVVINRSRSTYPVYPQPNYSISSGTKKLTAWVFWGYWFFDITSDDKWSRPLADSFHDPFSVLELFNER